MRTTSLKTLILASACALLPTTANAAATISLGEGKQLNIGLLLQPQVRVDEDGTADHRNVSFEPLLRRVRLVLSGQYTELVHFFVDTDSPNWGKQGDWSSRPYMQDAWLELNLHEALQIDMGMILLPFSHHGCQGAGSLLMVDYHSPLMRYPDGATRVWRDVGLMARGQFLGKRLEYRLAVTNGVQSAAGDTAGWPRFRNRLDAPWITGRLTANIFESEAGAGAAGFFYDGLYVTDEGDSLKSPKRIVSVGVSGSYQPRIRITAGGKEDFRALAADVFIDWPLADGTQAVNAQAGYYVYDQGEGHPDTGMGLLAEAGYRWHRFEPYVGFDWFDVSMGPEGDLLAVRGGLAYWLLGHTTSLRLELGATRRGDADPNNEDEFALDGVLQAQLAI